MDWRECHNKNVRCWLAVLLNGFFYWNRLYKFTRIIIFVIQNLFLNAEMDSAY
jgi:hypothetical protein